MHINKRAIEQPGLVASRMLGSWVTFIVISLSAALLGSFVDARTQAFDAAAGDAFGYPFDRQLQLVAVTADQRAHRVAYHELSAFARRYPGYSLLLPAGRLAVDANTPRESAEMTYVLLRSGQDKQVVETRYRDSEWSITSRYRVDGARIVPVYCRVWNLELIGTALLWYGLPLALTVLAVARLLRRRQEHRLLEQGELPYYHHHFRAS